LSQDNFAMKKIEKRIILFTLFFLLSFFCSKGSYAVNHNFTGLPLTADGWTDLSALVQNDSQIVYLSLSEGNDSTGQTYLSTDVEIGASPFNPTGTIKAYATFASAYNQLRDGYPDLLLIKRGEVWPDFPYVRLTKSGRSKTERQIIGAYGNSGDRPRLMNAGFSTEGSDHSIDFVIIADLFVAPSERSIVESGGPTGFSFSGNSTHILLEGCHIHLHRNNIVIQSSLPLGNPIVEDTALRRNVVTDAWGNNSHGQGLYISGVGNVLVEENIWDHNGWLLPYKDATVYDRNQYLSSYNFLIVRGEINARSASEGTQMREGGVYRHNLSIQNSNAIAMGHSQTSRDISGKISQNVVLDARDIGSSDRGFGMSIGNRTVNVELSDNIIAHQKTGGPYNVEAITISNETKMSYQYQLDPAHCSNGILETELGEELTYSSVAQCGGECVPCSCMDEIKNNDELAIDCGGSCWPCVYVINPTIRDNIVYKWHKPSGEDGLVIRIGQSANGINMENNIFQQLSSGTMISYSTGTYNHGPDESWFFGGNKYYAGSNPTPFEGTGMDDMDFPAWLSHNPEAESSYEQVNFPDPERTLETYTASLGLSPVDYQDGVDKFLVEARKQSRFNWRQEYTAYNVINYIREGFGKSAVFPNYVSAVEDFFAPIAPSGLNVL